MINNPYYNSFPNYPEVLNAKMIAEIMDLGYVKALKLIRYSGLNHIKIGNTYRVPKKLFIDWLYTKESKEIVFEE